MASKVLLALLFVVGLSACGGPSTVHRGATLPPPGMDQLSPLDAQRQWPDNDRDKERS